MASWETRELLARRREWALAKSDADVQVQNVEQTEHGNGRGSTKNAIYEAALDAFAEKGYSGASLRDIAQRVGVEVASLYNHISSKESLLFVIIMQTSRELYDALDEAREEASDGDELEVMRAVVRRHLVFNVTHSRHNFVGTVELRALTPDHRQEAVAIRGKVEGIYKQLVERCVAAGRLPANTSVTVAAYQLIALSMGVSDWFREGGELTVEEIADFTIDFIEHGLHLRSPR